ncbi:DMT family transporter [Erythrobacter rubeus]|uniref:DMT family transporter n=1 Tax=Erythrobacter rubeus TaxID=2760803 RepID=A0ABR8KSI0_9SPHN|nr:DMT family transporter [Erythrobacter rubeus]MBD2842362.1 DMT family transporter [Erythrobacter rubeus]
MDGSVARPRPLLALGVRLATAATLATMAMLVKLAGTRGVHLAELVFWRQAITLICVAGLLATWGRLATVKTNRFGAHARRAAYGLTGMFFVYGAVMLLPLPEATAISFTAPFFAVLISVLFFGETVGRYRWGAVVLGFAGVLLITEPSFLGGGSDLVDPFGAAVGLIAAALVALISFQIQDLNKTESPWSIVFWFTAITAPISALAVPFVIAPHDPITWAIIISVALCGALAQILLTTSLRFGSAAVILLMDYTSLLWATWYGWSVFDQAPGANLWVGAPLIIGAGVLIAWRERQLARINALADDGREPESLADH